jgi:hypothetical protein
MLEEEDNASSNTTYFARGRDGAKASQTVASHGIEHVDDKPLHQETRQIHLQ